MKLLAIILFTIYQLLFTISPSYAQSTTPNFPKENYHKGEVIEVINEGKKDIGGTKNPFQELRIKLENGKEVTIEHGGIFKITQEQLLSIGDPVIVLESTYNNTTTYSVTDNYRLPQVIYLGIGFFLLVIITAGKKGLGSIIGMVVSIGIIFYFIVPQILSGNNPLFISIVGSFCIMVATLYLAHGFSKTTSVALFSTSIALVITGLLSVFAVGAARLSGLGSESSYALQLGASSVNIQGLLLGGMIIGALGVLDDITTAQSATVFELAKANPKFNFANLFKRGFNVGKEHIASLVNTLVLAYAGASLGLFLLFVMNPSNQPYWVILNSEVITEEIVRTIVGSFGLIMAVPLTTFFAALIATKRIKFS